LGRGSPTTVSDPRRFLIDFLPIARRLVRRDGVSLHSIGYWSDVLSTWIGHAEPMIVRFDPRDLSRIYLLGPDGTYYDLTYRDLRRPPISLWEHRAALKRLREQGHAHVDEAAIFRAVQAMREIADQAAHTSKTARRQKERRRMVQQKQAVVAPAASAPVETNDLPANGQQPHEQMFPFEEWN
ncbi:TPA: Mu transposase C-terminal domain-containing protein, partial [Pseudomonas aeruginosa]